MLSPVSNRVRGGNSLHISCRNSASTKSFRQFSLTIHFYLKTIRGKLNKITLECDVLLKTSARFKPSVRYSRFNQAELKEDQRRFAPATPRYPQQRSASAF